MRALNILMLLALFLSCTKPPIPAVQEKDDEQKTEVEQSMPADISAYSGVRTPTPTPAWVVSRVCLLMSLRKCSKAT